MTTQIPKTVTIQYYALLREARGLSTETLETDAATVAQLYARLRETHRFPLVQSQLKVAVNDTFADWDTSLNDGDTVVFIPPVAGG